MIRIQIIDYDLEAETVTLSASGDQTLEPVVLPLERVPSGAIDLASLERRVLRELRRQQPLVRFMEPIHA